MAILGTRMPLPSSAPLARDKGKSDSSETPPQKLLDPRSTRALKIFACKPLACIESIQSAGQIRGSRQPDCMLTVAVFHNSPVQQFKQKTIFCASAPLVLPVFQRHRNRQMQTAGTAQIRALMLPLVPGNTLAVCGMPICASCSLFCHSFPQQPKGVLPVALGSLSAAKHSLGRERGWQPHHDRQQRFNPLDI